MKIFCIYLFFRGCVMSMNIIKEIVSASFVILRLSYSSYFIDGNLFYEGYSINVVISFQKTK